MSRRLSLNTNTASIISCSDAPHLKFAVAGEPQLRNTSSFFFTGPLIPYARRIMRGTSEAGR
jgi:hypothetical protein